MTSVPQPMLPTAITLTRKEGRKEGQKNGKRKGRKEGGREGRKEGREGGQEGERVREREREREKEKKKKAGPGVNAYESTYGPADLPFPPLSHSSLKRPQLNPNLLRDRCGQVCSTCYLEYPSFPPRPLQILPMSLKFSLYIHCFLEHSQGNCGT